MEIAEKKEMHTLVEVLDNLRRNGFPENFRVTEKGLQGGNSEKVYSPEDVKIVNFYRFEGDSDPADNAILYAVETNDGIKGSLTDAYGAYADDKVTKFTSRVEEIMKKTTIP